MKLETSRLVLTPITSEDWLLFKALHQSPEVMQFVAELPNEEEIKQRFESRLIDWDPKNNNWFTFTIALKETDQKIGVTGFYGQWQPYQQAELGFLLSPQFQGKGYAKESTLAVLDYLFNTCNFHKAVATVTEGNVPSFELLKSLGFKHEGTLRDNFKLNDTWYNDLKLGLLQHEFLQRT